MSSRGWSGSTEAWLIGVGTGLFVAGVLAFGGCGGGGDDDNDPRTDANYDCEEAWVVANDGDDETENETAILEQPWCQQHLQATATTVEATP